jgi:hypothetical protein
MLAEPIDALYPPGIGAKRLLYGELSRKNDLRLQSI